jgi:two-component system, chemotaxis family, response regulator Rcp1
MIDNSPLQLLLVEDNSADSALLRMLFNESAPHVEVHLAQDGDQASAFLSCEAPYQSSPVPDLILLDLNLPRKDGWELLKEVKSHPVHKLIPVILLSTSNNDREIAHAYELGAAAFLSKPIELESFRDMVHDFCRFWLQRVRLATRPEYIPLDRTA